MKNSSYSSIEQDLLYNVLSFDIVYFMKNEKALFNENKKLHRLGKYIDTFSGYAFKSSDWGKDYSYSLNSDCVPVLKISNIERHTKSCVGFDYVSQTKYNNPSILRLKRNDIVIAMSGSTCGKFGIIEFDKKCFVNQRVLVVRVKEEFDVLPDYLVEFIAVCTTNIIAKASGLGLKNIANKDYEKFKIQDFPSLTEQQRTLPLVQAKIKVIKAKIKELEEEKENKSLKNIIDIVFQEKLGIEIPNVESVPNSHYLVDIEDSYTDRLDFNFINYKNNIENKDTNNTIKVKRIATIIDTKKVKKGTEIYGQSIEFKEVLPYSGVIETPIHYTNYTVEGDRTAFDGCDVMFSKFNPQFGNNVLVTKENDKCVGSLEFWGLKLDKNKIIPQYFIYAMSTKQILVSFCYLVTGAKLILDGNGRSRVTPSQFYNLNIPVPDKTIQQEIIDEIKHRLDETKWYNDKISILQSIIDNDLNKYILNGYSDDLFNVPKGDEKE